MTVIELARQVGVAPHVVRYYARVGLLKPGRNPANGYRSFGHGDLERLRFIRLARRLRYSLQEIGMILEALELGEAPSAWMPGMLKHKLSSTRRQIAELRGLEHRVAGALAAYCRTPPAAVDLVGLADWMASVLGQESNT